MNHRRCFIWIMAVFFSGMAAIVCHCRAYGEESTLEVGNFSKIKNKDELPRGWEPLYFKKIKRHTTYEPVEENNTVVIRALSNSSSSGLICKTDIDPRTYPIISWRWKTSNIYDKGDVRKKEGDDYPARIYITFAYDPENVSFIDRVKFNAAKLLYGEYPPIAALNYIWANKAEKGIIVPNPYTSRAMMIVVESGSEKINTWVDYERNLVDDYQKAFGTNPPAISGVAIMTDSDNTNESATTYYGDIIFKKIH